MHEFSIANGLLRIVLEVAAAHQLRQVTVVRLDIGKLSGISIEALDFAWQYLKTTQELTATSSLEITETAGAGSCSACGFAGAVTEQARICPACGMGGLRFTAGEEMTLREISGE